MIKTQKPMNEFQEAVEHMFSREQRHVPEVDKAYGRLFAWPDHNGQTDLRKPVEAAMRWAILFAAKDLSTISEGDFKNLQYELAAIDLRDPIIEITSHVPTKAVIENVQSWLRENLRILVDMPRNHCVCYSVSKHLRILNWDSDTAEGPGKWTISLALEDGDHDREKVLEESLIGHLFELLHDNADNIRRCPCEDCRRIFLRNRANATCCSKICTSRHAKRKELGILPERFGKRGRPPGTVKTKGKTYGQKKAKKAATGARTPARRLSAKKP